jgi:glyoxylase-like metal-dependent hydrolase (beta-lactamase superfamily II)
VHEPQRIRLAYNNVYLVSGSDGSVLIDTGPDYEGAFAAIRGELAAAPTVVVATHGHSDHAGLGAAWQRLGVPVALGTADHHLARVHGLADPGEFALLAGFVRGSGAPADVAAEALAGLERRRAANLRPASEPYPPAGKPPRWPTGLRFEPFDPHPLTPSGLEVAEGLPEAAAGLRLTVAPSPPTSSPRALGEGAEPNTSDCNPHTGPRPYLPPAGAGEGGRGGDPAAGILPAGLRVVASPGHTPGNVVLVQEAEGWLFSGDQLLPEITPTPAIQGDPARPGARFRSLPAFRDSLRALSQLTFTRCYPGHGEPFDNVGEVIQANLDAIDQRSERVLAALRESGPSQLYGLCEALYRRAAGRRFWQIAPTVLGHLDVLEAEGLVTERDGIFDAAG